MFLAFQLKHATANETLLLLALLLQYRSFVKIGDNMGSVDEQDLESQKNAVKAEKQSQPGARGQRPGRGGGWAV